MFARDRMKGGARVDGLPERALRVDEDTGGGPVTSSSWPLLNALCLGPRETKSPPTKLLQLCGCIDVYSRCYQTRRCGKIPSLGFFPFEAPRACSGERERRGYPAPTDHPLYRDLKREICHAWLILGKRLKKGDVFSICKCAGKR